MPFQESSGNVFGRQGLVKGAGVQIDALFNDNQPFFDLLGSMAEPDAKSGGKNLGQGADINDMIGGQGLDRDNILTAIP